MASSATNNADASDPPADYDEIVPTESLIHGEHNPRKVRPDDELKRSVANDGIADPLIVRPDPDRDVYHITDGWQRYQAGVEAGMEAFPVRIYETPVEALQATEKQEFGKPWTTYDWAQCFQSLAEEAGESDESTHSVAAKVAEMTDKARSKVTVQRYLDVLSLPDAIHPLLNDGLSGTSQQWAALQNYNPSVKQYGSLWWQVAAKIARGPDETPANRQIGIAALAVTFESKSNAEEFVDEALANPHTDLDTIRKRVQIGRSYDQYLRVRSDIPLGKDNKEIIIEHLRRNGSSIGGLVEELLRDFADEAEN